MKCGTGPEAMRKGGAHTKNGVGIATDPTLTGGGFPKKRLSPGVSPSVPPPEGFGHPDKSPGARAGAEPVPGHIRGPEGRSRQVWRPVRSRGCNLGVSSGSTTQQAALLPIDAGAHRSDQPMSVPSRSQQSGSSFPEGAVLPFLLRDLAVIASSSSRFSTFLSRQAIQGSDPFSLSMSEECAGWPSRARARASTYPLCGEMPVDKGG